MTVVLPPGAAGYHPALAPGGYPSARAYPMHPGAVVPTPQPQPGAGPLTSFTDQELYLKYLRAKFEKERRGDTTGEEWPTS